MQRIYNVKLKKALACFEKQEFLDWLADYQVAE
jgi:hypothetical protein